LALEGHFRNAVVVEVGAWDIDGRSYPFVGLFNGRENVQLPIEKDCTPPADLAFGDLVDVWCRVSQGQKVVGDRSIGKLGLRAVSIERVAGEATGSLTERLHSLRTTEPLEAIA
jgi:hypothetical protein